MKLQFSISELSSYLDEIFPQVVDQYRIVELQPDFARVAQIVKTENFGLVKPFLVQPFLPY